MTTLASEYENQYYAGTPYEEPPIPYWAYLPPDESIKEIPPITDYGPANPYSLGIPLPLYNPNEQYTEPLQSFGQLSVDDLISRGLLGTDYSLLESGLANPVWDDLMRRSASYAEGGEVEYDPNASEDYWQFPGYGTEELAQPYEYPAAPAGAYGSSGVYLGDIPAALQAGEIDLPTALYQWNLATGEVAAADEAARQQYMADTNPQYENLRQQGIAEGAIRGDIWNTELGRGLQSANEAISSIPIPQLLAGYASSGYTGDESVDLGEFLGAKPPWADEATQAAGSVGRELGRYASGWLPDKPFQDVGQFVGEGLVPQNQFQLLLEAAPGIGDARGGFSAARRLLGGAEAGTGLLPALPGSYRAALNLTADVGGNIQGVRPFLAEAAGGPPGPGDVRRGNPNIGEYFVPNQARAEPTVIRLAVAPEAMAPLDQNSLMGSRGAQGILDPSGAKILQPGEAVPEGWIEMYHGTVGGLQGPIRVGLNITPDPGDAALFARTTGRVNDVLNEVPPAAGVNVNLNPPETINSRLLYGLRAENLSEAQWRQYAVGQGSGSGRPLRQGETWQSRAENVLGDSAARERLQLEGKVNLPDNEWNLLHAQYKAEYLNSQGPLVSAAPPVNTSGVNVNLSTYEKGLAGSTRPIEGPVNEFPFVNDESFSRALNPSTPEGKQLSSIPEGKAAQDYVQNVSTAAKQAGSVPPASPVGVAADTKLSESLRAPLEMPTRSGPPGAFAPDVSFMRRPAVVDPTSKLIENWQLDNIVKLDWQALNPDGLASRAAAVASNWKNGNYPDAYFNTLINRRQNLKDSLSLQTKFSPEDIKKITDGEVQSLLDQRFGHTSQQYKDYIDALKQHDSAVHKIADNYGMKFVDRWKNLVFGGALDWAVLGVQTESAMRHAGGDAIVGGVNKLMSALNIPGAVDVLGSRATSGLSKAAQFSSEGLGLRMNTGIYQPGSGTPLRYIPGLNILDEFAITPIMDANSKIQFQGILGTLRNLIAEGKLTALARTGEDINNPLIRDRAFTAANNVTSAAQTATTPGRAAVERTLVGSAPMLRSRIENVLDIGKLVTGNEVERKLAAMHLAQQVIYVTAVGWTLNEMFGITEYQMDPFKPGFGNIVLPTTNSKGEHHVVNIIPQASVERALIRSYNTLSGSDPESLKDIWGRFAISQSHPFTGDLALLGGYGYDANGKFRPGGMSWEERGKAALPIPTNLQGLIFQGKTDPLSIGLSTLGQSSFTEPMWVASNREDKSILNDPAKLATVLPPEIATLVQGKPSTQVGSRVRDEIESLKDPKAAEQEAKNLRAAGDPYQKYFDDREAVKNSYSATFDKLQNELRTTGNGYAVNKAIGLVESEMYRKLAEVPWPGKEGDPAKQTEMQKLESAYRNLWDKTPVDEEGKKDYKVLAAAQAAFINSIEDLPTRQLLQYNVESHVNPKEHPIQQYLDAAKPERDAYYAIPNPPGSFNAARNTYLVENPTANAKLWATGDVSELKTLEAVTAARQVAPDRNPIIDFNYGYRTNPDGTTATRSRVSDAAAAIYDIPSKTEPGYRPGAWEEWLRSHPRENAELYLANHVPNLVSLQAFQLVPNGVRR